MSDTPCAICLEAEAHDEQCPKTLISGDDLCVSCGTTRYGIHSEACSSWAMLGKMWAKRRNYEYQRAMRNERPFDIRQGADKPIKDRQVGGSHYVDHKIQPWDVVEEYKLDYFEGSVLKYLLRRKVNRLEDLRKAAHFLEKVIERAEFGHE